MGNMAVKFGERMNSAELRIEATVQIQASFAVRFRVVASSLIPGVAHSNLSCMKQSWGSALVYP